MGLLLVSSSFVIQGNRVFLFPRSADPPPSHLLASTSMRSGRLLPPLTPLTAPCWCPIRAIVTPLPHVPSCHCMSDSMQSLLCVPSSCPAWNHGPHVPQVSADSKLRACPLPCPRCLAGLQPEVRPTLAAGCRLLAVGVPPSTQLGQRQGP